MSRGRAAMTLLGAVIVLASCSSGCAGSSDSLASSINANLARVERLFPTGSKRLGTSSESNSQTDTFRTPIDVADIAASIARDHPVWCSRGGAPSCGGPGGPVFEFPGDNTCDGFYQVSLQWAPERPNCLATP